MPEPAGQASDRLHREINEILGNSPKLPAPLGRQLRSVDLGRPASPAVARGLSRVSSQLMLLAVGLIVVGFFADDVLPFAGYWLMIAGSLMFIASFALVIFVPRHAGPARNDSQRGQGGSSLHALVHRMRRSWTGLYRNR